MYSEHLTSAIMEDQQATDKVYEQVLTELSRSGAVDDEEQNGTLRILACILSARAALSLVALAELIEIKPETLRESLQNLDSIVYLPEDDKQPGLRTIHPSFGDYVYARAPQHLRLRATLGHEALARGCLRRLGQNDLSFNVSQSLSSFTPNSSTIPEIPLSLVYACLNWAHHIDCTLDSTTFDVDIGLVFRSKFLFWLEVLSIVRKTSAASGLLRIAGSTVS